MRSSLALVLVAFSLITTAAHAQLGPSPGYRIAPRHRIARFYPSLAIRTPSVAPAPAPTEPGELACRAEENGIYAPARIEIRRGAELVASGSCDQSFSLAPGSYSAIVTLETTLDRPTRTISVNVPSGGRATAFAPFATSVLEVRFFSSRIAVPGLAIVRRDGRDIGTLGSGIPARLSSGTYEIVARYRTLERRYTVVLAPGQRIALRADF